MPAWTPIPEPVTWAFATPVAFNGVTYAGVTLRAPTGEEIMKANAIPGSSQTDVLHRLAAEVSGVPYDVVKMLPWWKIRQMDEYFDEFAGAPAPDPLEAWRTTRREAQAAERAAQLAAEKAADPTAPPAP